MKKYLSLIYLLLFGCSQTSNCWILLSTSKITDQSTITGLVFTDRKHGLAVADSLLETTDGGQNWIEREDESINTFTPNGSRFYTSIVFVNQTTGWISGYQRINNEYKPIISHTTNGGRTWEEQLTDIFPTTSEPTPILKNMCFFDTNNGWAIGSHLIINTKNGGSSWKTCYKGDSGNRFLSVACTSPEHIWVVGTNGTILNSSNSGSTWCKQSTFTNSHLTKVKFFDSLGFVVGEKGTLLKSNDAGKTWQQHNLNINEDLLDVYFHGEEGWVVGKNGLILHSMDGGNHWERHKDLTKNDITSLFFLDSNNGWAGGSNTTILQFSTCQ